MNMIAIDFGGTRIKLGLIRDGELLKFAMLDVAPGAKMCHCLKLIEERIGEFLTEEEIRGLEGIGISYPGLVDFDKQTIIQGNKYEDAVELDLHAWVADSFGLPYVIDNDANAALLGELNFGCGKGYEDAVMMILGTGVGTAAAMNRQLVRGKHFQAGCLGGHFPIGQEERKCSCPGVDCVEAYASTWALPGLMKEHPLYEQSGLYHEQEKSFPALKRQVEQKDPVALEILNHCIRSWGKGIIALIYAYDPELVILSGGILNFGDALIRPLIQYVHQNAWTPWGKVEFRIAENKEQSVLLGLYYLLVNKLS